MAVGLALVGAACSPADDTAADGSAEVLTVGLDPSSTDPVDVAILSAQASVADDPEDLAARHALGDAFIAKARQSADPAYWDRVERLAAQTIEDHPDDLVALNQRGAALLAQHRFEAALEVGRTAVGVGPSTAAGLAVVVDALNELGRYDEAAEATQQMVDLRPDLASLARVSFARELRGDLGGAITAMQQARSTGSTDPVDVAFVEAQLGQLLLLAGQVDEAEAAFDAALALSATDITARGGQAKVAVARGEVDRAAELLGRAVEVAPVPELAIAWADALQAAGRADEATEADDLVEVLFALQADAGVSIDLELAVHLADAGRADEAVELAEAAVQRRPSTTAWDALAWASHRAGDLDCAEAAAAHAVELGTIDPQTRFHAAVIAEAAGHERAAAEHLEVVLATNPRFSAVLADEVTQMARRLGVDTEG